MKPFRIGVYALLGLLGLSNLGCGVPGALPAQTAEAVRVEREGTIPAGAVKVLPENDMHPPLALTGDYESPVPIPGEVNTAGAEDSVFITPDGKTLYFFFTPDVTVPVEKQILDGVTGLYVSRQVNGLWGKPERIFLQEAGKLALDGCEFVLGEWMWFCSAREGYTGLHWFTAEQRDGRWGNWQQADFDPAFEVGELHIGSAGSELYFGSSRADGRGGLDIWVSKLANGTWQEPENVAAVNTADSEGWPAMNPDGTELWFYRNYSIWRSGRVNGEWQEAVQILSPLAGEPSIDGAGNVYFVHHFYEGERMIEADIYVARKNRLL